MRVWGGWEGALLTHTEIYVVGLVTPEPPNLGPAFRLKCEGGFFFLIYSICFSNPVKCDITGADGLVPSTSAKPTCFAYQASNSQTTALSVGLHVVVSCQNPGSIVSPSFQSSAPKWTPSCPRHPTLQAPLGTDISRALSAIACSIGKCLPFPSARLSQHGECLPSHAGRDPLSLGVPRHLLTYCG